MIRNIQVTKRGDESDNSSNTLFSSPNSWEEDGANLVLYKNNKPLARNRDYEVQDENTILLTAAAKSSDEFSFIITQIVDPSDMYSHDERMHQLDRIDKKIEGKAQTSINKRVTEETIPSKFIIHSNDIWTSKISDNIATAQSENTAVARSLFSLTEDKTVAGQRGWYATSDGKMSGRLINWIPPQFGKPYTIRLYDATNTEIPSSDPMSWKWDYQSGYLIIENDFDYQTPFKISGFQYSGRFGVGSLTHWKEPVFSLDDLPLYHNDDGDIRLILTENKFYRYDSIAKKWDPLNYGSSSFLDPVLDKEDLPQINNMRGDIRLVLGESNLYVWDDAYGQTGSWVLLTGQGFNPSNYYDIDEVDNLLQLKSEKNHTHDTLYLREEEVRNLVRWRPARESFNDLPPYTENKDGDVILTKDTNTIWRWYTDDPNSGQGHWDAIVQSNFSWKTPVVSRPDLPISGNSPGDVRLVTEEEKIYFWHGAGWSPIVADVDEHSHDERYILKTKLHWKEPVDTFDDLPENGNYSGDCRLVLDTNYIYRWNDAASEWIEVIQRSHWLDPILLFSELPSTSEEHDVIYVKEHNQLYAYSDDMWWPIEAADHDHDDLYYTKSDVDSFIDNVNQLIENHTHDGNDSVQIDYNNLLNIPRFYWKNPVVSETDLPLSNNSVGDARIVLDAKAIYTWSGSEWELISGGAFDHNHDEDYYSKADVDALLQQMQISFANQLNNKADLIHNHNDLYYTKNEVEVALSEKADADHSHDWSHDHDDRYYTQYELETPGRSEVHWDNITNKPASISDAWKTPVQYEVNLPTTNNNEGDLRLVLDTSDVWRWDGDDWINIGHWTGPQVDHWESPVDELTDLPFTNNFDGDIRLVKAENILYRWDEASLDWIKMCCGDSADPGSGDGSIDDNDVGGLSYEEIQVYLNGLQGIEGEDWEKTSSTSIRILAAVDETDLITIIIIGDSMKRYDFRGGSEGQIDINLATTFFRKEIELSVPTSLFTLPVPYNPGQKDLVVWLNGVLQRVGKDYTELSSTEFLFDRMLSVGDRLIIVILGFTSGEENYFREDYTVEFEDQKDFDLVNEYAPGTKQLLVYLNGQLQMQGDDYVEIDENSIQLVSEREIKIGDYITFIILKGLAIGGGGTIINYASDLLLGWPTDGKWSDGFVHLHSEMNVADAIDEINEALLEIVPNELVSLKDVLLVPEGIDFYSGFVSDGNIYIDGQPGDYFNNLTNDREFYLHTPENSFMKADQGTIRLFVNGIEADSFNLENAFVEADRDGNQVATHYGIKSQGAQDTVGLPGTGGAIRNSTNGYIQIMSIEKYGYKKIQKGELRLKFFNGILRHGYNYIHLTHSYESIINTTKQFKFFVDTKHIFPDFTGTQTLFEQQINSEKYVSGVRYYSIGDSFRTTFNIANFAYTVYSAEPFEIDMPGLNPIQVEYNDSNLSHVSDPPHIDDVAEYRGNFTLNSFNEFSVDGVVTIKTNTPFGTGPEYTFVSKNRLVNTYTNGSSPLVEYFRDEIYRLPAEDYDTVPAQKSYVWDSTQPLQNGEAILFDKGLRYANMNFIDYMPEQPIDYSGFSGPQTYYRSFAKNIPRNNGYFIITGITKNDLLMNKIIFDIKLPTQTGWLSLNKYYEVSEFNGVDGDGCLIDSADDKFYYSSGTFSTAYSGYTIIVRITLPNDSAPVIKHLELKW